MAESPAVLEAYLSLDGLQGKTALTGIERHVALLAIAREFGCRYCVAAHSAFAKMDGVPPDQVERLRQGESLGDPRLEQLHRFAAKMVARYGQVSDADVQALLAAGYTRRHVLEVMLLIANKLIAAYANRVMGTDLDEVLQGESWAQAA
jgi:AhpD family alkylhydroperoxidase